MKNIKLLHLVLLCFCFKLQGKTIVDNPIKKFTLSSTAFANKGNIPSKHTCDGEDISPALAWQNAPANTKSFALIVDDPDAPKANPWVHWIVFNIPASVTELKEDIRSDTYEQGATDFNGKKEWGGPCPPSGTHRYYFKLYALDTILKLSKSTDKDAVLKAIEGHILDQAELMGTYKKKK